MSFSLPSISNAPSNQILRSKEGEKQQEVLLKREASSSSITSFSTKTSSQKDKLPSLSSLSKEALHSFMRDVTLDNEDEELVPFNHSFMPLKIDPNASPSSKRRIIRQAKQRASQNTKQLEKFIAAGMMRNESPSSQSDCTDTEASTLSSLSNETSSSSVFTNTSSSNSDFAAFSISTSDFKTINPNLDFSKERATPALRALHRTAIRKTRSKLNQCIAEDPSILHSHGEIRSNKIKTALEKIGSSKLDNSSLPPLV